MQRHSPTLDSPSPPGARRTAFATSPVRTPLRNEDAGEKQKEEEEEGVTMSPLPPHTAPDRGAGTATPPPSWLRPGPPCIARKEKSGRSRASFPRRGGSGRGAALGGAEASWELAWRRRRRTSPQLGSRLPRALPQGSTGRAAAPPQPLPARGGCRSPSQALPVLFSRNPLKKTKPNPITRTLVFNLLPGLKNILKGYKPVRA